MDISDKIINWFLKRKYKERYTILGCLQDNMYANMETSATIFDLSLTIPNIAERTRLNAALVQAHIEVLIGENHIKSANPTEKVSENLLLYITKEGTFAYFNDYYEHSLNKQMGFAKNIATTLLAIVGALGLLRAIVMAILSYFKA